MQKDDLSDERHRICCQYYGGAGADAARSVNDRGVGRVGTPGAVGMSPACDEPGFVGMISVLTV